MNLLTWLIAKALGKRDGGQPDQTTEDALVQGTPLGLDLPAVAGQQKVTEDPKKKLQSTKTTR